MRPKKKKSSILHGQIINCPALHEGANLGRLNFRASCWDTHYVRCVSSSVKRRPVWPDGRYSVCRPKWARSKSVESFTARSLVRKKCTRDKKGRWKAKSQIKSRMEINSYFLAICEFPTGRSPFSTSRQFSISDIKINVKFIQYTMYFSATSEERKGKAWLFF